MEVTTAETRKQINEVLNALRNDKEKSRRMLPDGTYIREKGGKGTSSQEALYRYFSTIQVSVNDKEVIQSPETELSIQAPITPHITAVSEITAPVKKQKKESAFSRLRSLFRK